MLTITCSNIFTSRPRPSVGALAPSAMLGLVVMLLVASFSSSAEAAKLRDLTQVEGARDNQLLGYGIVTGLRGSGDDITSPLAAQSTLAMLRRLGVRVESKRVQLRNVAAVVVTATIPAFATPGTKLDVTVSSIGNAKSLRGGVLVQTPLKGADRKTYAVAQGSLAIGGVRVSGKSGSAVSINVTTAGRVPNGALVERRILTKFVHKGALRLSLRRPSFPLAARIVTAIDKKLGVGSAIAVDGGTISLKIPDKYKKSTVSLIAMLGTLEVKTVRHARIVVGERTQTIVASGDVKLAPVAIVHGDLTIVVKEQPQVSQPTGALTRGTTKVVDQSKVSVKEKESTVHYMNGAATLSDLASALGALSLTARQLVSVLQALKAAGALEAEIVVQ
jgi:flagellar P-ring protein FlgI